VLAETVYVEISSLLCLSIHACKLCSPIVSDWLFLILFIKFMSKSLQITAVSYVYGGLAFLNCINSTHALVLYSLQMKKLLAQKLN
jgi:hypothetical protein